MKNNTVKAPNPNSSFCLHKGVDGYCSSSVLAFSFASALHQVREGTHLWGQRVLLLRYQSVTASISQTVSAKVDSSAQRSKGMSSCAGGPRTAQWAGGTITFLFIWKLLVCWHHRFLTKCSFFPFFISIYALIFARNACFSQHNFFFFYFFRVLLLETFCILL